MVAVQRKACVTGMERWLNGEGNEDMRPLWMWFWCQNDTSGVRDSVGAEVAGSVGKGNKNVGSPPIRMIKSFDRVVGVNAFQYFQGSPIIKFIRKTSRGARP